MAAKTMKRLIFPGSLILRQRLPEFGLAKFVQRQCAEVKALLYKWLVWFLGFERVSAEGSQKANQASAANII